VDLEKEKQKETQHAQQVAQLIADGAHYIEAGAYQKPSGANAKESFEKVLLLDPKNEIAKEKLDEIDSLLRVQADTVEALLARAEVYSSLGQYLTPDGENAFAMIERVREIDPNNTRASNILLEMAAECVYQGDLAGQEGRDKEMKEAYRTAQMLGVSHSFVEERLRGGGLDSEEKSIADGHLDTKEVEKRVAALILEQDSP